jgi:hypothetical protein
LFSLEEEVLLDEASRDAENATNAFPTIEKKSPMKPRGGSVLQTTSTPQPWSEAVPVQDKKVLASDIEASSDASEFTKLPEEEGSSAEDGDFDDEEDTPRGDGGGDEFHVGGGGDDEDMSTLKEEVTESIFASLDPSNQGYINTVNFCNAIRSVLDTHNMYDEMKIFQTVNTSGSGTVSQEELNVWLKEEDNVELKRKFLRFGNAETGGSTGMTMI